MRLKEIKLLSDDECCELQARASSDAFREPLILWYRFPSELSAFINLDNGDPFLAALLLPAMRAGESLEISAPISQRLASSIDQIQAIYHCWDRTLSKVEVRAPIRESEPRRGSEAGLFFSSGVDSFYSLISNDQKPPGDGDAITSLIVVHGFDIRIGEWKKDIFEKVLINTRMIAKHFGKSVLPVETNIKDFTKDSGIPWGSHGHGAALASIGLTLSCLFKKIFIASTSTYANLYPTGSHPILDPLWSTESTDFVHDGCEATRLEKIRLIAQSQLALDTLRVCWEAKSPDYNCGRCSKCLRTMVGLHIAGALRKCPTLGQRIDIELLRNLPLANEEEIVFLESLADELRGSERDEPLLAALVESLDIWKGFFARLRKANKGIAALIPLRDKFILVDQDTIREKLGAGRRIIPFLERDGQFAGNPPDDETAIREVERQRIAGAKFMVFWWPALWFLEYYSGLKHHLRSHYRCILQDDSLTIFDLGQSWLAHELSRVRTDCASLARGIEERREGKNLS